MLCIICILHYTSSHYSSIHRSRIEQRTSYFSPRVFRFSRRNLPSLRHERMGIPALQFTLSENGLPPVFSFFFLFLFLALRFSSGSRRFFLLSRPSILFGLEAFFLFSPFIPLRARGFFSLFLFLLFSVSSFSALLFLRPRQEKRLRIFNLWFGNTKATFGRRAPHGPAFSLSF